MKSTKITAFVLAFVFSFLALALAALIIGKDNVLLFANKKSMPVYFLKMIDNEPRLMPLRRKIISGEAKLKNALDNLITGITENEKKLGYYSEIPKNTKIIEIKEDKFRAVINLSKDFESGGGSSSMVFRLEQLVNTALDNVSQKPVYLELEGKRVDYIGGEGVIVPQPLSRNLSRGQEG
jgi:spore germination protein GerM